ncbi:MAG: DUF3549 family protein [Gammaproteobacteria bacterium]|nr:DUF3549 family protein [Gammaproteobacteria bacterium]
MPQRAEISTLYEFLAATGARLRTFDMGRHLLKIPGERFLRFEQSEIPYPTPLHRQAWFALLFQEPQPESEPFVWFLRFPLDEQAKLNQAARDDFMHRLVERVGVNLQAAREGGKMEAALQDNPYSFKPRDDRLAVFHARISRHLKAAPSRHYAHARAYFSGELGWDQWPFIGYQGIADVAARFDQDDNSAMLRQALPQLPDRPLVALCHCLENEPIDAALSSALLRAARASLCHSPPSVSVLAALVRAISRSVSQTARRQLLQEVLDHPLATEADVLAALAARAWQQLAGAEMTAPFLERLARNNQGQAFFDHCLADLLFIPGMREPLLAGLRNPARSAELSSAVGAFFRQLGSG